MNKFLIEKVNNYIDLAGKVMGTGEYGSYTEKSGSLLMRPTYNKKDYFVLKNKIFDEMIKCCKTIKNIDALIIALFALRSTIKILMYRENPAEYSLELKIFNKSFCAAYKSLFEKERYECVMSEHQKVQYLFNLAYIYYNNMERYNELFFQRYKDSVSSFYQDINRMTNIKEDMYSYDIKNKDINFYLEKRKLDEKTFQNKMSRSLENIFLSKVQYSLDIPTTNILKSKNQSYKFDDIIIINKNEYDRIKNKNFKGFVGNFSINKHNDLDRDETELIFSYFSLDGNVYISKKLMEVTQSLIEKFIKWCQFVKVISYFYGFEKLRDNEKCYNKIMTYKIADLLVENGYVLPLDKKKINGKKIIIPKIEIDKIEKNDNIRSLGDFDVIFYSPFSKKLYNLEYKNYQMMITEEGCLNKEIEKVEDDNIVKKVLEREKYLLNNFDKVKETLYKEQDIYIKSVQTIILTTKPNLYFYIYKPDKYFYYEWVEFMKKVKLHFF